MIYHLSLVISLTPGPVRPGSMCHIIYIHTLLINIYAYIYLNIHVVVVLHDTCSSCCLACDVMSSRE